VNKTKVVQRDDGAVCVEIGERVYLISGECPHRKGRMKFAYINEKALSVRCPLHHSIFDLNTGCRLAGPAEGPLPVLGVHPASGEGDAGAPCPREE
jgi:nitrite reductase/ring-hydroxylating ferredoxin subunit